MDRLIKPLVSFSKTVNRASKREEELSLFPSVNSSVELLMTRECVSAFFQCGITITELSVAIRGWVIHIEKGNIRRENKNIIQTLIINNRPNIRVNKIKEAQWEEGSFSKIGLHW